jgi:hypothetical protein
MNSFKKPDFVQRRDAAAHAKKAALEKFHKSAADPAFAERQTARIASAKGSAQLPAEPTKKVMISHRSVDSAEQVRRNEPHASLA